MAVGKFVNKGTASGGGTLTLTLREYTAGTTWSKPAGLVSVDVICLGGGGGGGGGARRATGVVSRGGSGGGGGAVSFTQVLASSLSSTETVTIGAGGTAGAAVTADSTAGTAGGNGGQTSFGTHCVAPGGLGGGADGATTGQVALSASWNPDYAFGAAVSGAGRSSSASGLAGTNGPAQELGEQANSFNSNLGAPSGGGISTANAQSAGGASNRMLNYTGTLLTAVTGGTAGGGAGSAGTANVVDRMVWPANIQLEGPSYEIGLSGSGGGSNLTGAGGTGGAGGNYGAAGAGGGASRNGNNSGAGGAGSGGLCFVLEYTVS